MKSLPPVHLAAGLPTIGDPCRLAQIAGASDQDEPTRTRELRGAPARLWEASRPGPLVIASCAPSGGFGLDKAPLTDISRGLRDRTPGADLEPVATLSAA